MSLNKDNKDTFWFFDDVNLMMLHQNYGLVFDNGKHDGAEKSCHAYYVYEDVDFILGLLKCRDVIKRKNKLTKWLFGPEYFQWKRYPQIEWYHQPMSRDHYIYILCALKYAKFPEHNINYYVERTRLQLSKSNWLTLKVWAWSKLIGGKKIGKIYYPLALFSMMFYKNWNKVIDYLGEFGEEWSQEDWANKPHPKPNKFQKVLRGLRYPTYAIKLNAFMLSVLPNTWFKRQIQRQTWPIIPKYNYALKLMLNHPDFISIDEIFKYKSMMGDRWSDNVHPLLNPRELPIINDNNLLKDNRLDYDFLIKLYANKKLEWLNIT